MNPDDPRAQRSRARLRETVLLLATDRDPASITMAEVAKRAGVHRATVYQHFPDVDTLLAEAMADAVAHVARAAALCPLEAPAHSVPPPLVELFQRFDEAAPLYQRMLGPQGSAQFGAHLRERLTMELTEAFRSGRRPPGFNDVPLPLHAAYLSGALIGVVANWLTDPASVRADEAAAAFWRLFRG